MITVGWLLVLLTVGAVVRLTRLVTEDVLFQPFRRFVIRHRPVPPEREPIKIDRYLADGVTFRETLEVPDQDRTPDEDWLVYLVHCRWCASVWISAAVVPVVYNWPDAWWVQIPLIALTASLVAGLSGRWE